MTLYTGYCYETSYTRVDLWSARSVSATAELLVSRVKIAWKARSDMQQYVDLEILTFDLHLFNKAMQVLHTFILSSP